MKTSDFYYDLPPELIAQTPIKQRDSSRLLICKRGSAEVEHGYFSDIRAHLSSGDCLVLNRTRVIPARLLGARKDTGGAIEFLLLKRVEQRRFEVLVKPGCRAKVGAEFAFGDCLGAKVISVNEDSGSRIVEFEYDGIWEEVLDKVGIMPLPPYITRQLEEKERYQTVYSKETGSAAAPTAGLHFTTELLEELKTKGVIIVEILLHVGLGTFRPVKEADVEKHVMHSEYYEVSEQNALDINRARENGGRIICVGTTSVRTLETVADDKGVVHAGAGNTNIFITPPYDFKAVDGLITNFHLPESTLLMLVSAFMGKENALAAYKCAVEERYRFFSFGDAMFIASPPDCGRAGTPEYVPSGDGAFA